MDHVVVYKEQGIYAGWPANHGAWQWGDEFLVGFLRGKYRRKSMHNVVEPFQKCLARSLDGGQTWALEIPNVDFEPVAADVTEAPPFSLSNSIIRGCGVYDHGGDYCPPGGAFYLSHDRGKLWEGPFAFTGVDFAPGMHCTARTCVQGDMVFLSEASIDSWGTDTSFVTWHDGTKFKRFHTIPNGPGRSVMPAAAMVGGTLLVVTRRRKVGTGNCWVDAFAYENGEWSFVSRVGETGGYNGSPPALVALPTGEFVCAFANRSDRKIYACKSSDGGKSWSWPIVVREGGDADIGYPRLFVRSDGVPVCIYYWADKDNSQQHIVATALECL